MKLSTLFSMALLTLWAGFPCAEARSQSALLVQKHISLDLYVDYDDAGLLGSAAVTIQNQGEDALTVIPLQLGRLMSVERVEDGEGRPLAFDQDIVRYADFPKLQILQVWVTLPQALDAGAETIIRVAYGGTLVGYSETGMGYVRDRVDPGFTIIRTDAWAFPVISEPSIADLVSRRFEDFTFDATITLSEPDLIAATGVSGVKGETADGEVAWEFTSLSPVPFLNIAIAPFEVLEREQVHIYHFAGDSAGASRLLEAAEASLRSYTEWFGPITMDRPLIIIEIPEGWGSQASLSGGIIQTADAFREDETMPQLFHELAHLWHPSELDRPADRWSEGLATFLQWRMASVWASESTFDERMSDLVARQHERVRDDPVAMIQFGDTGSTGLSYGTGAAMFYALYRTLGARSFDEQMASYFVEYRASGATSEQFTSHFQQAGPPGVERLFHDWLYTTSWIDRLSAGESFDELVASYRE